MSCNLAVGALCGIALCLQSASAQVLRVDRIDRMTDKRSTYLVVPSRDGRTALAVTCAGYVVRSSDFAALSGAARLLVRLDRNAVISMSGEFRRPDYLVWRPGDVAAFSEQLQRSTSLALRLEAPIAKDFEFEWSVDHKAAFGAAVENAGGDRAAASIGFETLTQGLSRAAAGQYRSLADLMAAMRVPWRVNGRVADTGSVIGPIMSAMAANTSKKEVEDAGHVMFGPGWTAIRVLLKPGSEPYRVINGSLAVQLAWLETACSS